MFFKLTGRFKNSGMGFPRTLTRQLIEYLTIQRFHFFDPVMMALEERVPGLQKKKRRLLTTCGSFSLFTAVFTTSHQLDQPARTWPACQHGQSGASASNQQSLARPAIARLAGR